MKKAGNLTCYRYFKFNNLFCSFSMLFVVLPGGTAVVSSPGAVVLSSVDRNEKF